MSQFNPTVRIVQDAPQPDLLAGAVLNGLSRPLYYKLSWGPFRAMVITALTLGVLPVLGINRWMRKIFAQHEQQLWHLAEWIRIQAPDPDALELQKASQQVRLNLPLAVAAVGCVLVAVATAVYQVADSAAPLRALYRFAFQWPTTPGPLLFTLALSAAAVCLMGQLYSHQQQMAHFLQWFNQIARRQELPPVEPPPMELGLGIAWILGGLTLALAGAVWGLPIMLAAGAHRRYTIVKSVAIRAALAERLRTMLAARRPSMRLPKPIAVIRACVRPACRAPLPSVAGFCPRCGTPAPRKLAIVA